MYVKALGCGCLVCIPSLLSLSVTLISEPSFLSVWRVIYAFVMIVEDVAQC